MVRWCMSLLLIFPFVRGATLFSTSGRTVFLVFAVLIDSTIVQIPSDRRIDEAVGRWTNERVGVVQGYAEMHASNGNRLFSKYIVRTCPIQVPSDNASSSSSSIIHGSSKLKGGPSGQEKGIWMRRAEMRYRYDSA
ncbi:hypothetical protein GGI43DRAFT_408383 [Trichoderma evansii]